MRWVIKNWLRQVIMLLTKTLLDVRLVKITSWEHLRLRKSFVPQETWREDWVPDGCGGEDVKVQLARELLFTQRE